GTIGIATWGLEPAFPASAVWDEELQAQGAGPDPLSLVRQDDLMDTTEKIYDLLKGAGFERVRFWAGVFEHQWDAESFYALRSSQGAYRRRLDTLAPEIGR